ncbi:MAG: response regulator [Anaerolineales bacterium]|nr:response regulator [Anaerolineales bacterium]MCS7246884.1 response regulator [Anaerolineales bacterium]MDW8160695.1 response regulator [Anaerolineales bacterium]MDW8448167.1 response regulator [Anaerolineales bacterium]
MSPRKVVLIEDNQMMRNLLGELLRMEGHQVVSLASIEPEEAVIRELVDQKPDLVFLDVNLNGRDTFAFVQKLRSSCGDIRVLMSSGMPLEAESLAVGADDFLMKPFMPDELLDKVRSLLGTG